MRKLIINGITIPDGACQQVNISSYKLPTNTVIDIPALVYKSKIEGPVVLFMAGVHGNEINGVEMLRQLIRSQELSKLKKGSVIVIPILNIISFLNHTRDLPDGKDLNRSFPGSKNGSFGSRIAYDLITQIIPQIDCGVDFHTGGAQLSNYPQIRCVFDDPKSFELAKKFGAPFIINSPYRDKSLRKEAAKKGKPFLVYEAGESSRISKRCVDQGYYGCLRLLQSMDMISVDIDPEESKILKDSEWVRAKRSGLFWSYKRYGSAVKKDEPLGTVSDPFGEIEQTILSPVKGFIIALNNSPVINNGDALYHIGTE